MQTFSRTLSSAVAAILVAGILTFATVAPVEAGTGCMAALDAERFLAMAEFEEKRAAA